MSLSVKIVENGSKANLQYTNKYAKNLHLFLKLSVID